MTNSADQIEAGNSYVSEAEVLQHLRGDRLRRMYWTLGLLCLGAGLLTVSRVVLGGIENARPFGAIVFLGLLGLIFALKLGVRVRLIAVITLSTMTLVFAVQAYLSGGLKSHFMMMALFLPLLGVHLHGLRAGAVCAVACALIVVGFCALHLTGHRFPQLPVSEAVGFLIQGGAILVFVAAGTFILAYYFRLSDHLAMAIWERANHDHLTGLANRRVVDAVLEREAKLARRNRTELSVLMVDVDHFKRFNDGNGHVAGDACLLAVATALAGVARRPTDLVGRFGGEEFILILPQTSTPGAISLAEQLCEAVRALGIATASGAGEVVTISVGVTTSSGPNADGDVLLSCADKALYAAKQAGRNRVCTVLPAGSVVRAA